MQELNKTKAALQGRQCHYTKQSQLITLIDQVNRRYFRSCAGGTQPVAEFDIRRVLNRAQNYALKQNQHVSKALKSALEQNQCIRKASNFTLALTAPLSQLIWVRPNLDTSTQSSNSGFPHWGISEKSESYLFYSSLAFLRWRCLVGQLFGSIPRDFSSFRITLLSQAEIDSSPSISIACFIAFSRPGSTLKAICLLPRGNFVFDICLTRCLSCLCLTMYNTFKAFVKQRSPEVLPTRSGLLTKPLYEVTIMADIKSTQTRPKYHFRFLALDRVNMNATPCRMSVEAHTEREARKVLAPHFILSFAARLPVEVRHV